MRLTEQQQRDVEQVIPMVHRFVERQFNEDDHADLLAEGMLWVCELRAGHFREDHGSGAAWPTYVWNCLRRGWFTRRYRAQGKFERRMLKGVKIDWEGAMGNYEDLPVAEMNERLSLCDPVDVEVLKASTIGGESYREIAERKGFNHQRASYRARRARRRLAEIERRASV